MALKISHGRWGKTTPKEIPDLNKIHQGHPQKEGNQGQDLCGHPERCRMPDIENNRKTAEKTAEWVPGKAPRKQP